MLRWGRTYVRAPSLKCSPALRDVRVGGKVIGRVAVGATGHKVIKLFENSRAVAFWKGRLVPYASLSSMLHWMQWKPNQEERHDKRLQEIQSRTLMLLFFAERAPVDVTKFNLQDDLHTGLKKECAANGLESVLAARR